MVSFVWQPFLLLFLFLIGPCHLDFQLFRYPLKSQRWTLQETEAPESQWFPSCNPGSEGRENSLQRRSEPGRQAENLGRSRGLQGRVITACSALPGPITLTLRRPKRIKSWRKRKKSTSHENALYFPLFPFMFRLTSLCYYPKNNDFKCDTFKLTLNLALFLFLLTFYSEGYVMKEPRAIWNGWAMKH